MARQPQARVMLLLWYLLPALAAVASPEQSESRRQQIWRNGDEAQIVEEGKAENPRSAETWRALRTNRQKLRELTWEKFNEKQKETEGLQEMQVLDWEKEKFCHDFHFSGPPWVA